jgi:hypothetical protein
VAEPVEDMQSDETCRDRLVQVAVSQRVRVRVSHEHLSKLTPVFMTDYEQLPILVLFGEWKWVWLLTSGCDAICYKCAHFCRNLLLPYLR